MTKVNVVSGNITTVVSQALITAINPRGMWFGGVDMAIERSSGNMFHHQASMAMPLENGQIIFAPKTGPHNGKFDGVLFVVDSLTTPIYDLLLPVFKEADRLGLKSVSVHPIGISVMDEHPESQVEAFEGLLKAIIDIIESKPVNLQEINVVIYNSPSDLELWQNRLKELSA